MQIRLIATRGTRLPFNFSGVYPLPPLGIALLATRLKAQGHKVEIIDLPLIRRNSSEESRILFSGKPDIIGISSTLFGLREVKNITPKIKSAITSAPVVLGGACTVFDGEVLLNNLPDVDYVIKGEGEESFNCFANNLKNQDNHLETPGLSYRCQDKILCNPLPPPVNLEKSAFPDRTLLKNHLYKMHPPFGLYPPVTLIESARGCNYNCIFCSLPRKTRERSPENIIEEISEVIKRYHIREIHFVDPTFTSNKERIFSLTKLMNKMPTFHWTCKTRPDCVSMELLKAMKKSGCYLISFGVESGSEMILKNLRKEMTLEASRCAFENSRKADIRTIAYCLTGSPGETWKSMFQTLKFMLDLKADYALFGMLMPDPGSELTKESIKEGHISKEMLELMYFNKEFKVDKREYFLGHDRLKLKSWTILMLLLFYVNPYYIFRRIFSLKNLRDLRTLADGGFRLIQSFLKFR